MKFLRWAGPVLDALIVVALLGAFVGMFTNYFAYESGLDFQSRFLVFVFAFGVLRALTLVDWQALRRSRRTGYDFYVIFSFIIFTMCLWHTYHESLYHAIRGVITLRGSFREETPEAVAAATSNLNQYYPSYDHVMELMELIPEEDSIAWMGDMRAHIFTYEFYPRKLYMIPLLQEVLNRNAMECYAWSPVNDPIYPLTHPFGQIDPLPLEAHPEALAQFEQMLAERDIDWVVAYDTLHPEWSRVWRLK